MVDAQGYFTLFLISLLSVIVLRVILTKLTSRLPPGPRALPIIGHLHLLAPLLPHQAFHKLSRKFGPLMHISIGSIPCLVVSSPEMAKETLKTQETSFLNRPHMTVIEYLNYGSDDFGFIPHGPYWQFMKKICMSELLGGRTLDHLQSYRKEEIHDFLKVIFKRAKAGESVDMSAELLRLANNLISRMMMNVRCSENQNEAEEAKELVDEILVMLGKFNLSDCIWFFKHLDVQGIKKKLKGIRERFHKMMDKIIMEHEEARKKKKIGGDGGNAIQDILDILLDIAENEESEMKLTKGNIKAFMLDMFVAGTDTSAITTQWALSELINHPNIVQKVRDEINSVVGKNKLVEESDVQHLPYLQAIVKETLRLHPTAPLVVRESSEDCTIGEYKIPAKTRLIVNVWSINKDPNYWENPLEFIPERFAIKEGNGSNRVDVRGQHFQLLPFGSGRRSCPGASLALKVVHTSLANLIQCFDWKVTSGGNDGKVDMEEGPGLTLPRANPLVSIPVARFDPFSLI